MSRLNLSPILQLLVSVLAVALWLYSPGFRSAGREAPVPPFFFFDPPVTSPAPHVNVRRW